MSEERKNEIVDALKEVYDPEIPINVYDLGLIYEISIDDTKVHVLMTLTSPTCPTAEYIQERIKESIEELEWTSKVDVELTFNPRWTPDKVSIEAREELGLEIDPTEDLALQSTFQSVEEPIKDKVCFNCGATDKDFPILACQYKGESTFICTKCVPKFN